MWCGNGHEYDIISVPENACCDKLVVMFDDIAFLIDYLDENSGLCENIDDIQIIKEILNIINPNSHIYSYADVGMLNVIANDFSRIVWESQISQETARNSCVNFHMVEHNIRMIDNKYNIMVPCCAPIVQYKMSSIDSYTSIGCIGLDKYYHFIIN